LPTVVDVLITGRIALLFLNSPDQVSLYHSGVILHSQITSFGSDILEKHRFLLWSPRPHYQLLMILTGPIGHQGAPPNEAARWSIPDQGFKALAIMSSESKALAKFFRKNAAV
jgi:hypothetical protein